MIWWFRFGKLISLLPLTSWTVGRWHSEFLLSPFKLITLRSCQLQVVLIYSIILILFATCTAWYECQRFYFRNLSDREEGGGGEGVARGWITLERWMPTGSNIGIGNPEWHTGVVVGVVGVAVVVVWSAARGCFVEAPSKANNQSVNRGVMNDITDRNRIYH